jgi:hypothetical protein
LDGDCVDGLFRVKIYGRSIGARTQLVTKPKKSPGGFTWGKPSSSTSSSSSGGKGTIDDSKAMAAAAMLAEVPIYGPLLDDCVVHRASLARLVRLTSLHAARRVRLAASHHHGISAGSSPSSSNPYLQRQMIIESNCFISL